MPKRPYVVCMGPNTLFDKSFVQSLSDDEAVIFDALFCAIIAPVFYAEVLANLAKEPEKNVSPEKRVAALTEKTPVMHCYPTTFHTSVVAARTQHRIQGPDDWCADADRRQGQSG